MIKFTTLSSEETLSLSTVAIRAVINGTPDSTAEYFYISRTNNVSFYKEESNQPLVWNKGSNKWESCKSFPPVLHRLSNLATPLESSEIIDNSINLVVDSFVESLGLDDILTYLQKNLSEGYFVGAPPVGETAFFLNYSIEQGWAVVHTIYDQANASVYNPLVSNSLVAMKALSDLLNNNKITPKNIKLT